MTECSPEQRNGGPGIPEEDEPNLAHLRDPADNDTHAIKAAQHLLDVSRPSFGRHLRQEIVSAIHPCSVSMWCTSPEKQAGGLSQTQSTTWTILPRWLVSKPAPAETKPWTPKERWRTNRNDTAVGGQPLIAPEMRLNCTVVGRGRCYML